MAAYYNDLNIGAAPDNPIVIDEDAIHFDPWNHVPFFALDNGYGFGGDKGDNGDNNGDDNGDDNGGNNDDDDELRFILDFSEGEFADIPPDNIIFFKTRMTTKTHPPSSTKKTYFTISAYRSQ
jgi:hypothetical protein